MKEKNVTQYKLFLEDDLLINTLYTEKSAITDEIERTIKTIEKKQEYLAELQGREKNLFKCVKAIKKIVKPKERGGIIAEVTLPPAEVVIPVNKGKREKRV